MAVFDHPLDDPAAVFVDAVFNQMGVYHFDDVFDLLALGLRANHYKYLLDNVVSVEIEGTFFYAVVLDKFLHHSQLLVELEHFEAGLDYAAAVFVG